MNLSNWKNRFSISVFDAAMLLLLIGLFYSRFIMSISAGLIPIVAVIYSIKAKSLKEDILSFFNDRRLLSLSLIPILYLSSGLISDDHSEWWRFSKSKLIFFLFPLAIYIYSRHKNLLKSSIIYSYAFVGLCLASSIPILWGFFSDMSTKIELLGKGIPLDTPFNHIIYSLYIAIAALITWVHYNSSAIQKNYKIGLSLVLIYLVFFIHLLAVRSGIVVFYASFLILIVYKLWKNKNIKKALMTVGSLVIVAVICYQLSPSLQRRISYMKWDIDRYKESGGYSYSDSERINSLIAGIHVWQENPWLGVGVGSTKNRIEDYYLSNWSRQAQEAKLPHNQYLFCLVSFGICGLFIFMIGFFYPLKYMFRNSHTEYLVSVIMVFAISFLVNNTIERSVGSYLYVIAVSLIILMPKNSDYASDNFSEAKNLDTAF